MQTAPFMQFGSALGSHIKYIVAWNQRSSSPQVGIRLMKGLSTAVSFNMVVVETVPWDSHSASSHRGVRRPPLGNGNHRVDRLERHQKFSLLSYYFGAVSKGFVVSGGFSGGLGL